jgi:hypothetical protein
MPGTLSPADVNGSAPQAGGRRGASVKTLKKMLKKAGLKTTGRKAALTRRAKKAHLKMRGGEDEMKEEMLPPAPMGAGRHGRSRRR